MDVFEQYKACEGIFTDKQWETIYFYYQVGLTQLEIAQQLCKKRNTITDRLNRAKRRKEEHDKKLRGERLDYLRRKKENDED